MIKCPNCGELNNRLMRLCVSCKRDLAADKEIGPALWNPNAAANWSLLFSPAFGAYLHTLNARALGRDAEARANLRWFYTALTFLFLTLLSVLTPDIPEGIFRLIGFALLLAWYFSAGKKQAGFVKETYGADYERKSWGKPLGIAVGCLVGFVFLAFVVAVVAEL